VAMNCEWISDHLTEVVDGLLTPAEQELVDAHLATCEECSSLIEELRADAFALQTLGQVEVPIDLRKRVADAIAKPKVTKNPWKFFVPRLAPVAAAVLVSVLSINLVPTYLASRTKSLQMAPEGVGQFQTVGIAAEPPQPQAKSGTGDIVVDDKQTVESSTESNPSMRNSSVTFSVTTIDGAEMSTFGAAAESEKPSMWMVSSAAGSTVFLLWGALVYHWYKRQ